MNKLRLLLNQFSAFLTSKLRNNFYLYLSALLTVFVLLDASVFHVGENMRDRAFDFMVKNRVIVPKADPNIVIVDIDEASLSAMAKEYGRWPWPRQVFGEFVENIETQQPKAIVFDILFSDPDIYNPDSDAYFNDVIAATDNTFFPMLRLSEASDKLSKVTPDMIPGVTRMPETGSTPVTTISPKPIAIVLPHFDAAVKSGRLGTHNIYQDIDGIAREYRLWHNESGYLLPSLPLTVSSFVQKPEGKLPQNMLLNWRGKPFTYQYVSFSDVFADMANKDKKRSQTEFKDKIVIIGSTAPSLFDLKATAMAKAHPGVEILATAIDNLNQDDYLKVWRGKFPYIFMSLLLIWVTAIAMFRNVDRDRVTTLFSSSQIGLLVASYIAINVTNTYLDFTAPITWAVIYFSVAKIYALANDRVMQRNFTSDVTLAKQGTSVLLMTISLESEELISENKLKKLQRRIEQHSRQTVQVHMLKGTQTGIWGLLSDILIVSWTYHGEDTTQRQNVAQDQQQLAAQLKTLANESGLPKVLNIRYSTHEDTLVNIAKQRDIQANTGFASADLYLASQWRRMLAEALIKLEQQVNNT